MKTYKRLLIMICCTVILFSNTFMYSTIPVYASEGVYDPDTSWWEKFLEESSSYLAYLACRVGALVEDHDFAKWVQARSDYKEWWNTGHISRLEDSSGNVNYTFDKELMAYIKQCLDEYAKTEQTKEENGGFYLMPTINYEDVSMDTFNNSYMYYTFRNIMREKGVLSVRLRNGDVWFNDAFSDPDHLILLVGDASSLNNYLNNPEVRVSANYFCANDWKIERFPLMYFKETDKIHYSCDEAVQYNTGNAGYVSGTALNKMDTYNYTLYSTTGERVRVFVSEYAAKNYSAGNRKIYFSENYYTYEPEDLTVAIDDLQKSVDDLQKIIDELLEKIGNNTSEKEIEELLRQILEELRNNPGGGGSGSGSGDVTVSVDLKETNSWLSKIYNRLGDILSKMSESAGQSMDAVVDGIENLKKMLEKYLKTITSDLDDIKGQLEDMSEQEFNDKSDSFLDSATESFSEISEVAKTKFPFSIPNDLRNLLAVISPASPEASSAALLSVDQAGYDDTGPASYDGMISVMDDSGGEAAHLSSTGAPVFHLPIVVESVGWDYAITVDLSGFQIVATLSRTFFTLIFIVGLIQLSIKVIGLWGDLVQ